MSSSVGLVLLAYDIKTLRLVFNGSNISFLRKTLPLFNDINSLVNFSNVLDDIKVFISLVNVLSTVPSESVILSVVKLILDAVSKIVANSTCRFLSNSSGATTFFLVCLTSSDFLIP